MHVDKNPRVQESLNEQEAAPQVISVTFPVTQQRVQSHSLQNRVNSHVSNNEINDVPEVAHIVPEAVLVDNGGDESVQARLDTLEAQVRVMNHRPIHNRPSEAAVPIFDQPIGNVDPQEIEDRRSRRRWMVYAVSVFLLVVIAVGATVAIMSTVSGDGESSAAVAPDDGSNTPKPDGTLVPTSPAPVTTSAPDATTSAPIATTAPIITPAPITTPNPTIAVTRNPTPFPTPAPSPFPTAIDPFWKVLGQELKGRENKDRKGHALALSRDANIVAVSVPEDNALGYVAVYRLNDSSQTWTPMGQQIVGNATQDLFGWSVALSGDGRVLAIGSPGNDRGRIGPGHVSVYQFNGSRWVLIGSHVIGREERDNFGLSVSLSDNGEILAVGACESFINGTGFVRLYNRSTNPPWQQMGQTLEGQEELSLFGHSVSLSNSGFIVGVGAHDHGSRDQGRVSVYEYRSSSWVPLGAPLNGDSTAGRFGHSVSLSDSGLVIAVGSRWGRGLRRGSVAVFDHDRSASVWRRRGQVIDGKSEGDMFGWVVSLSHDGQMVIGGARNSSDVGLRTGQARVFGYNPDRTEWVQVGADLNGEYPEEQFGKSVYLSGTSARPVVAVGGPKQNGEKGRAVVYYLIR